MSDRTDLKADLQMVQVVLHWAWDPIGVRGIDGAIDEYDSYAPHVLGMLQRGSSVNEIADYLTWVERDRMGLSRRNTDKNEDVAAMLQGLHAIRSGSRHSPG